MGTSLFFLLLSLGLILLAAEAFTNAIEMIGRRMAFSQAVVGSILAAVGTALPETILPLVAIFSHRGETSCEIGVGAILGAPFMLATIGFFLVGASALVASRRAGRVAEVRAEHRTLRRDLLFFVIMYSSAVLLPVVFGHSVTVPLAVLLVAGYVYYVRRTMRGPSAEMHHFEGLHLTWLPEKFGWLQPRERNIAWAYVQLAAALGVMVWGAHIFVAHLEVVATALGMSPLLFALLVAPVATELPEKFNSVTWTLKGKDTLAVGNITGAMVFQSTFPVSVGLLFTPWQVEGLALVSALLALASAALLLAVSWRGGRIPPVVMMAGGLFYATYAAWVVFVK